MNTDYNADAAPTAVADGPFQIEDLPEVPPARDGAGVRSARTLAQGAVFAAITAIVTALSGLDLGPQTNWKLLGIALAQTAGTAVVTYLHNTIKR
ncbi:hypothetical protein [Actinomadura oligospora]|uniref:hypothetical protein n=1 Tax=Actinomadura oligospora TaxID=111804 RepID=UPI0012F71971|nr:hypothetical protein [Actinomadura oligospora]